MLLYFIARKSWRLGFMLSGWNGGGQTGGGQDKIKPLKSHRQALGHLLLAFSQAHLWDSTVSLNTLYASAPGSLHRLFVMHRWLCTLHLASSSCKFLS